MPRRCPNCQSIVTGHSNKKFCGPRCKDQHHNWTNPRGKFAHLRLTEDEAEQRERDREHREAMDAQEWSESPGGFFG